MVQALLVLSYAFVPLGTGFIIFAWRDERLPYEQRLGRSLTLKNMYLHVLDGEGVLL